MKKRELWTKEIKVKDTNFCFKARIGCEDIAEEFIKAFEEYRPAIERAFMDSHFPKEIEVLIKHWDKEYAGCFHASNLIILSAKSLRFLKESINPNYAMMGLFLHELAHWLTPNEDEDDYEYVSEWLKAT